MSDNFIQLNEDLIKHDLKDLVRSSVEGNSVLLFMHMTTKIRAIRFDFLLALFNVHCPMD